ncbi:CinA family protein [Brevundimonas balnearis]|uniref:CinA family protein n=1 Tax=Brevundimonas balnearis TaxID=1572858 RepID=A0ABV6R1J6_9CAUL
MSETLSQALGGDLEARVEAVLRALCDRNWTIATAESCTGGLLASVLTDVQGVSHAFERGFVTYTEAAKVQDIGVPARLIEDEGAVSEAVARAMAEGARDVSDADLAVAITGYAGPGGPDDEEGLVQVALAGPEGLALHRRLRLGPVGRDAVRLASVEAAVGLIEDALKA